MKKQSRLVKFTIAIRRDTQLLIDQKAHDDNRSRSSLIDVLCAAALKQNIKAEQKSNSE